MFQLKNYQQRCLDELTEYFRRIIALQSVTDKPEKLAFDEQGCRARSQPVKELPGLPYVGLRVPTDDRGCTRSSPSPVARPAETAGRGQALPRPRGGAYPPFGGAAGPYPRRVCFWVV